MKPRVRMNRLLPIARVDEIAETGRIELQKNGQYMGVVRHRLTRETGE